MRLSGWCISKSTLVFLHTGFFSTSLFSLEGSIWYLGVLPQISLLALFILKLTFFSFMCWQNISRFKSPFSLYFIIRQNTPNRSLFKHHTISKHATLSELPINHFYYSILEKTCNIHWSYTSCLGRDGIMVGVLRFHCTEITNPTNIFIKSLRYYIQTVAEITETNIWSNVTIPS